MQRLCGWRSCIQNSRSDWVPGLVLQIHCWEGQQGLQIRMQGSNGRHGLALLLHCRGCMAGEDSEALKSRGKERCGARAVPCRECMVRKQRILQYRIQKAIGCQDIALQRVCGCAGNRGLRYVGKGAIVRQGKSVLRCSECAAGQEGKALRGQGLIARCKDRCLLIFIGVAGDCVI